MSSHASSYVYFVRRASWEAVTQTFARKYNYIARDTLCTTSLLLFLFFFWQSRLYLVVIHGILMTGLKMNKLLKISIIEKRKKKFCLGEKHLKFGDVSPLSSFSFDFRHLL